MYFTHLIHMTLWMVLRNGRGFISLSVLMVYQDIYSFFFFLEIPWRSMNAINENLSILFMYVVEGGNKLEVFIDSFSLFSFLFLSPRNSNKQKRTMIYGTQHNSK